MSNLIVNTTYPYAVNSKEEDIAIAFLGISRESYDKICENFKNRLGYVLIYTDSIERIEELGYTPETIVIGENVTFDKIPSNLNFIQVTNEIGKDKDNAYSLSEEVLDEPTKDYETYLEKTIDYISYDSLRVRMDKLIKEREKEIIELLQGIKSFDDIEKVRPKLLSMFSSKDSTTLNHTKGVCDLAKTMQFGMALTDQELSQENAKTLFAAALLHDLGKLVTPDQLIKNNDSFTSSEYSVMQQHVFRNFQFRENSFIKNLYDLALTHHYRYGGGGYSEQNIIGEDISIITRMLTVIDSFEAMNSNHRPYTKNTPTQAEKSFENIILGVEKGQFDPNCSIAFLVGLQYRLSTDEEFKNGFIKKELDKEKSINKDSTTTKEEKFTSIMNGLTTSIDTLTDKKNQTK